MTASARSLLAGIGFGVGDELGHGFSRKGRSDHHDVGAAGDSPNRDGVADEIEFEIAVERRVTGVRKTSEQQRVAIGRRTHDHLGGNVRARARPVLDDERLTKPLRKPLADHTPDDVVPAAGGEADDQRDRPRRIGLRPSSAGEGRQRGSAGGQMQECAAGKFHGVPCGALRTLGTTQLP